MRASATHTHGTRAAFWLWKGLIAYIVLLPLMVVRGVPVVGAKLQLSDLLFLALCLMLWWAMRQGAWSWRRTPVLPVLGIFLGIAAISMVLSGFTKASVLEVLGYAYMACLYLVVVNSIRTWSEWIRVIEIWVAVSTVVALIGVVGVFFAYRGIVTPFAVHYPYFFNLIKHPFWIATSTFLASPTPNMVYGYLHLGFFLTLGLLVSAWRRPRRRAWYLVALIIHLVAVLLTYSRGWLALVVGSFVFLWQFRSRLVLVLSHAMFLLVLFVAVLVEGPSLYNVHQVSLTITPASPNLSVEERERAYAYLQPNVPFHRLQFEATYAPFSRVYLYRAALKMFHQQPWLGIGPGNFSEEIYRRQRQGETWDGLRVTTPWDPHSTYLGGLAELGFLGGVAIVMMFGLAVWQVLQAMRRAGSVPGPSVLWGLFSGLVGYLVYAFDVDMLTMRWFWFAAALGGCAGACQAGSREPRGGRAMTAG